MYVVNIVWLRGSIACHWLACTWLSPCFSLKHAETISTISFQNATDTGVHQGRKYKLFNWNIILKVRSHLIVNPKVDIRITGRCVENERISSSMLLIGSGHSISHWFAFSLLSHWKTSLWSTNGGNYKMTQFSSICVFFIHWLFSDLKYQTIFDTRESRYTTRHGIQTNIQTNTQTSPEDQVSVQLILRFTILFFPPFLFLFQ